ncbi:acetyltransferase [Sphingomonas sp. Sph1(2015)]|jgi:putative acetyltransferase|uniref:acetyltransferase n=1 Tax=Sphingomonas sp. Sph1(2015) TaxID=1628084 RepID=UPI00403E3FB1
MDTNGRAAFPYHVPKREGARPASRQLKVVKASRYCAAMFTIRFSRPTDGARVLEIWRGAVNATHHFLSVEDRLAIDREVCAFLPQAPLTLAVDQNDHPLGFMLIDDGHMEALFIDPAAFGHGIGAALVRHGLALYPGMTTDVNEQNAQAVGFYKRMGFTQTGRSSCDGQGRPYPLIHLVHRS